MEIIERFATKSPCWKTNEFQMTLNADDPRADPRYQSYYASHKKLMLHSVGCPRASADVQADKWNNENNNNAIAHAVIDSNDGNVRQTLKWEMRGWHCCNPGNNEYIGVEMCESDAIRYYTGTRFSILDTETAKRHCKTTYNSAVELFARLCLMFDCDPNKDIISHKEGAAMGIASDHGDPEHYWKGLGMPYTMDTFRDAVQEKIATLLSPIYRVQVGAFRVRAYAERFLLEVQKHFPDAYITTK